MPIAAKMAEFIKRSSWIRAMFENGAKLKAEVGAENVFDFSLGNPFVEPPESFYRALERLARDHTPGSHGYMPNAGYPQVRQKVADMLNRATGLDFGPNEIIMTVGAAGAANITFKALLNPGDEVVVPAPYFVEYDFYADNHGGKVVPVPCGEGFSLDPAAIGEAIGERTAAVMINSPNNPTGAVYSQKQLEELAKVLDEAGRRLGRPIYLISDEPYRRIVFDGIEVPQVFMAYPHSIVCTSFSKDLSLAGERLGYAAVHPQAHDKEHLLAAMVLANRILGFVNAPGLMQKVVGEILEDSADLRQYTQKRHMICQVLEEAGFEFHKPQGAFYVFPKSPIEDDVAFVKEAMKEYLLLVPGSGFRGPGHFRVAFCCPDEVIERSAPAFKRLRERF